MMLQVVATLPKTNKVQVNIVLARVLDLLGSELLQEDLKKELKGFTSVISEKLERQDTYIQRSLAIIDNQ